MWPRIRTAQKYRNAVCGVYDRDHDDVASTLARVAPCRANDDGRTTAPVM